LWPKSFAPQVEALHLNHCVQGGLRASRAISIPPIHFSADERESNRSLATTSLCLENKKVSPLNFQLGKQGHQACLGKGTRDKPKHGTMGWILRLSARLGVNLFAVGVKPVVIAAIMRHSDISTILICYIKTPDSESREAMEMLEQGIKSRPSGFW
jgi:hypothetical protein